MTCKESDDPLSPSKIKLDSEMNNYFFKKIIDSRKFTTEIDSRGIISLEITDKKQKIKIAR